VKKIKEAEMPMLIPTYPFFKCTKY